ncbi:MAG TPA: hypothetical protein DEF41_11245 [Desulfovibrio sp.]|nr:hypothetical protein [Desulfovibrio sp.]
MPSCSLLIGIRNEQRLRQSCARCAGAFAGGAAQAPSGGNSSKKLRMLGCSGEVVADHGR